LTGNVRVGVNDSPHLGRGELAKSDAEQVANIRRLVEGSASTSQRPRKRASGWR
jgi:3,5-dioxohexanoate:acetyl-CoA acetone transferase